MTRGVLFPCPCSLPSLSLSFFFSLLSCPLPPSPLVCSFLPTFFSLSFFFSFVLSPFPHFFRFLFSLPMSSISLLRPFSLHLSFRPFPLHPFSLSIYLPYLLLPCPVFLPFIPVFSSSSFSSSTFSLLLHSPSSPFWFSAMHHDFSFIPHLFSRRYNFSLVFSKPFLAPLCLPPPPSPLFGFSPFSS